MNRLAGVAATLGGEEDAARPRCVAFRLGEAARREAASLLLSRRPAHVEGAAQLSVSHAAGMRSRSGRQTHSDRLVEDEPQNALRPRLPTEGAINPSRQTMPNG